MIGFGIAQRTVLLEPDEFSLETVVENQADYIVLQPDALAANPGKQTITVSGAESVFLSYGPATWRPGSATPPTSPSGTTPRPRSSRAR